MMTVRRLKARSTLVIDSRASGAVAIVWSGRVRLSIVSPAGVAVTLHTGEPGECLGLAAAVLGFDAGGGVRLNAVAPSMLLTFAVEHLLAEARQCQLLNAALMRTLAGAAIDYAARVYELAALDTRARLQGELLRIARRGQWKVGKLVVVDAPTQAALGAQIGAAREAVTRHLKELADEGLVTFRRGLIEFHDLERLERMDRAATGRAMWGLKQRS